MIEKMRFRPQVAADAATSPASSWRVVSSDWRAGLPTLHGEQVTLRDLRLTDAPALVATLTTEEVARFISPPPPTLDGFERYILSAHRQRAEGTCVCFAIVPAGAEHAVGIVQIRQTEPGFETAEWGFAIDSRYWGTGLFAEAAPLVADFVFDTLGAHRLEARAAVVNGRGNGALRKLGAVQEGILRKSLLRQGQWLDQILWTLVDEDWRLARTGMTPRVH